MSTADKLDKLKKEWKSNVSKGRLKEAVLVMKEMRKLQ